MRQDYEHEHKSKTNWNCRGCFSGGTENHHTGAYYSSPHRCPLGSIKGQTMKPTRTDVKVRRESIRVPNSSFQGFSSTTLHVGDLFVYTCDIEGIRKVAKCHGTVRVLKPDAIYPEKCFIFAQILFANLQSSGERWVNPESVIETIPSERVSPHLIKYFAELERNQ